LSLLKHRYIFFCSYVSYSPEVKIDNKYGIAKILNVLETLFESNPDIKPSLCYHVVAYSHIKKYHWYGAEYRQSDNFVRKTKKGAHVKETKSAAVRHKKITTDLNY
jgi:hypothetical protein